MNVPSFHAFPRPTRNPSHCADGASRNASGRLKCCLQPDLVAYFKVFTHSGLILTLGYALDVPVAAEVSFFGIGVFFVGPFCRVVPL